MAKRDLSPRPADLSGHIPALDGIRGLAILAVVAHNCNVIEGTGGVLQRGVSLLMDWGWVGVQLFFVLSGFLITGILLDTRRSDNYYRAFFGRRVLRIFPVYYAVLIATFVVAPLLTGHPVAGHEHQGWLWTYLSNWAEPFGLTVAIFPHFWSLAVEEQFYAIWPFGLRRWRIIVLVWVCAAIIAVTPLIRMVLRAVAGPMPPYMFTICRFDALAVGAVVAALLRMPRALGRIGRWHKGLGWAACVALLLGAVVTRGYPRTGPMTQTVGYTILGLAFGVLVFNVVQAHLRGGTWLSRLLSIGPLRAVGKYSYAMYVLHAPLHLLVGLPLLARLSPGGRPGLGLSLGYFAGATGVVFIAAFLSYHLVEKHFLRLKRWFIPVQKEAG